MHFILSTLCLSDFDGESGKVNLRNDGVSKRANRFKRKGSGYEAVGREDASDTRAPGFEFI